MTQRIWEVACEVVVGHADFCNRVVGTTDANIAATAGGIQLFTATGAQTMEIGAASVGATFTLEDNELARFTDYNELTIGEDGTQSD